MFVKVCGIRSVEDLRMVEKYADATGVVVECESKRRISLEKAREIVEQAEIPVFVVSTLDSFEDWARVIDAINATHVQIHSDVEPELVERVKSEFGVFVMKAFRVPRESENPEDDAGKLLGRIEQFEVDRVLLDTGKGSGLTHDHRVSRLVARKVDVVLAGGLNPDNVREVVEFVRPFGVDVSSGVERDGKKSEELVRLFVERLRGI